MNPLLENFNTPFETPPFENIKEEHFLPALKEAISRARSEIDKITANPSTPDFENTIEALERTGELVSRISEIFFNLNSAETNEEIQKIAREFSPLLSEYGNDIMLNEKLFERVKGVYENRSGLMLNEEQAMLLDKTYRAFSRNGALLKGEDRKRLREIDQELSGLSLEFGENVLNETNSFQLLLEKEEELEGLPADLVEAAADAAKENGQEGKWMFTLHYPSYVPFVTYSAHRGLREKMVKAYGSRAFKQNDKDNRKIVKKIASLRYERARLLGFENHADFILQERMAETPEKVSKFLEDLLKAAKPFAISEVKELEKFAGERDALDTLQKWDFAYYSEKLKQQKFEIDDEILKPYFELNKVISGAFEVARRLYGISFHERTDIPRYHPDVKTYEVLDDKGDHMAVLYADFFPRKGKRAGAWMTGFRPQKKVNGVDIRPHVSIVCNFTKPTRTKPSLLTFNEVLTLFHEFGHSLHGILAGGTYASLSGTSVYWDFVELPSQIMENWCYEKECLDIFARHYETGELIPEDLIKRLRESASFMEGYATVRQIGLARLDMAWHDTDPSIVKDVADYEREVLKDSELLPWIETNNTSCSFSHIFQGGYSAGYYSYKWAEVLDADAFEYFSEEGIFDPGVAGRFKSLLSAGGSRHPMTLYKEFRGKEPDPSALLRRAGLVKEKIS